VNAAVDRRAPGRPRDARADEAILQATVELVAEEGLAGWSMDAVAARAGVGKATIYRRWPSKEALVLDAWHRVAAPLPVPDTGTLREDVLCLLGAVVDSVHTSKGIEVLPHIVAAARNDAMLGAAFAEYVRGRRQPLRTVLERARDRGELPADADLELVQDSMAGPLFYRLLFWNAPVDHDWLARTIDLVLAGLAAGSTTPSGR
jgi:AcrR family transcriptional regulator